MGKTAPLQIILTAFWLLALGFSLPLFEPHEIGRLITIGCACIASLITIHFISRDGLMLSASRLLDIALLFTLWLFLSIFWSPALNISFVTFCTFCLLPLGFFCFALRAFDYKSTKTLFNIIIFFICGLALWAIVQYFFVSDLLVNGGVRYPFANPNSYAALLSLGAFTTLGLLFMRDQTHKIFYAAAVTLMIAAIIIIGSRGALLAFIIAGIIFLILRRKDIASHKKYIIMLCSGALLTVILTSFLHHDSVVPLQRYGSLLSGEDKSLNSRIDIWLAAAAMIKALPWHGSGLGTFFLYYPEHRLPHETFSSGLMTHSDPLQFYVEAGWVAVVLFYAFLGFMTWYVFKHYRPDTEYAPLTAALFCGLGAMILHSHVSFNLYVAVLLLLSGMMAGLLVSLLAITNKNTLIIKPGEKARLWIAATSVISFAALLYYLQGFLVSEYYANKARDLALSENVEAYARAVNKANHAAFERNARPYVYAATIPLSILQSGAALSAQDRQGHIDRARQMLDKAYQLNPRLSSIYFYRAEIANINGDREEAMNWLTQGLRIDPLHHPSRLKLAEYYVSLNKPKEALKILKDGLHWPTRFQSPLDYYLLTISIATQLEDKKTAAQAQQKLEAYNKTL